MGINIFNNSLVAAGPTEVMKETDCDGVELVDAPPFIPENLNIKTNATEESLETIEIISEESETIDAEIFPKETIGEPITETNAEAASSITLLGNYKITGYVATGNPTASGVYPHVGSVAMNKQEMKDLGISYGQKIYIDNLGEFVVLDCGCSRGVVDVFCSLIEECYNITSYKDVYLIYD